MKRLAVLIMLWAFTVGVAHAQGAQVTDERGVTQRWSAPPQRVVSLLPSLTETVCALGACERLVGVDRYSNWPEAVKAVPKVGGGLDPQIEAVLALRPDVVFIAGSSRAIDQLAALGLKVVVMEPKSLDDVPRVLHQVAQALGVSQARADGAWARIEEAIATAAQNLPAAAHGARVYFEVSSAAYGASESSFAGQMLTRLGVGNILPAAMGPYPKVNPEFVVRANPDLIMVGDQTHVALAQRPGWAAMSALKNGRVCVFSQAESDVLVRPGPRADEAVRLLVRCLGRKVRP
jgi:iron complex transport system substrate-binding protein